MNDIGTLAIVVAVLAVFLGIPLVWLYFLVRKHLHPGRSFVLNYIATLTIIVISSLTAIAVAVGFGVRPGALTGLIGYASAALAWTFCKARLTRERSGKRAGSTDPTSVDSVPQSRSSPPPSAQQTTAFLQGLSRRFSRPPRWVAASGAAALPLLGAIYFGAFYMHSRAAGELAGTFTWASNKFCLTPTSRQLMRGIVKRLEEDEAWWRDAFNSGFVAANQKLNAAETAIGERKTCSLYIGPYQAEIDAGSVKFGWWQFAVF